MIRQPIITVMGHVDHGKCVSGETLLELGDGRLVTAESVFERFRSGYPIDQPDGIVYATRDLRLLSRDENGTVLPKKVSYVWKLTSKQLVHINTKAGYEIKTTPEHKFMILTKEGKPAYVESRELKLGDSLLIPSKTTTIPLTLEELKNKIFTGLSDIFLLKISKELNNEIATFCSNEGIYKIGKMVDDRSLWQHVKKGYYRPSVLRKILSYLSYPEESNFYDQIEKIKFSTMKRRASHKSFWLKIPHEQNEFEALYYTLGLLYGDGISGDANLSNTSQVIIEEFRKRIMQAFGIGTKSVWQRTSYIVYHKGGKTFEKFLASLFKYPEVDKTRILEAPDIICAAPNSLVAKFIKGFFDAEGFVEAANHNGSVGVSCESPLLMKQLPILLHRFGCLAYFVKRKSRSALEICISGSKNLNSFHDNIGFSEPSKSEQLKKNIEKSVSSRIFESTPINGEFVKQFREKYNVVGKRDFQLHYYESKQRLTSHALSKLLTLTQDHNEVVLASILSSYNIIQVSELKMLEGNFSVYDFTIEDTHNFMANGMIVHNTSLLDKIRNTAIANKEAGGITQHIGASEVPIDIIKKICGPLMKKMNAEIAIPGLLFIDTPGHEAFTNLRKRGGAVSDLAILVVDISKSFEPQTYEAIEILKSYKTPFVVAANKIDLTTGWMPQGTYSFIESIEKQRREVQDALEGSVYGLVGKLSELGFNAERFDRVKDPKVELSIIPLSAKTGEGIAELLMFTAGLSQKFLGKRLDIDPNEPGRGSIIEKKEERGLGQTLDVILYNGTLSTDDTVAFATAAGVKTAKIRALLKPKPLEELRDSTSKFYYVDMVSAAAGVKVSGSGFEDALAGSLLLATKQKDYEREIEAEIKGVFSTDDSGLILKADTIGSIEAISKLLKDSDIKISKKEIGTVTKRDVLEAFSRRGTDPYSSIVIAFNVNIEDDAKLESEATKVPIISSNIIYKLLDDYKLWADAEKKDEQKRIEESLVYPAEIKVLPNSCFRISHPAVFGVNIAKGKIKPGYLIMKQDGEVIGKVKEIQDNGVNLQQAKKGDSVAISVEEVTFGRQLKENDILYTFVNDAVVRLFLYKYNSLLDDEEKKLLDKIYEINQSNKKKGEE